MNIIQELKTYGIYKGVIGLDLVNTWYKSYISDIMLSGTFKESYNQYFKEISKEFDFFLQHESTIDACMNSKYRIRDIHAVLTMPANSYLNINGHATKWHTDYQNSFALMVLLNDISINDSHMEFIIGKKFSPELRLDSFNTTKYHVQSCIGRAGTFFLFNNGAYLHRARILSNNPRATLHAVYLPSVM